MWSTQPYHISVTRINDILLQASTECCPKPTASRKQTKFKWLSELHPLVETRKHMYAKWKASNCSNPELYRLKQTAKSALRIAQKHIVAQREDSPIPRSYVCITMQHQALPQTDG